MIRVVAALLLLPGAPLLGAAAPASSFSMAQPMPDFRLPPRRLPTVATPKGYETAPTPNAEASAPSRGRASTDASVAPGLFGRRDQYRGEGLSPSSSAQIEQDRRAKPGAGINLRMPLQ